MDRLPTHSFPRVRCISVAVVFFEKFHHRGDPDQRILRILPAVRRFQVKQGKERQGGALILLLPG